jgi:hypothetical protein
MPAPFAAKAGLAQLDESGRSSGQNALYPHKASICRIRYGLPAKLALHCWLDHTTGKHE